MIPILQLIDYTEMKSKQRTQFIKQPQIEDYKKCMDTSHKDYISKDCLNLKYKMEHIMLFNIYH